MCVTYRKGLQGMKKITNIMLMLVLFVGAMLAPLTVLADSDGKTDAIDEKFGAPIVVYGGSLSDTEKKKVKDSLNITENSDVQEIIVTGQDLAKYLKDGDASARMFSSAKITRKEAGKGLVIDIVTPDNITQVTADMYANAMLTAGIQDAVVEIAAPKPVTGHSALVGIYKAYEVTGGELDPERTDVANDELSVATILSKDAGVDEAKVSELLTGIKKQIAEQNPASREDIEKIVSEQLSKLKIELSDKDRQLLVDLMDRIRQLDIDFSKWSDQLSDLSKTIEEKLSGIKDNEGFWKSVKEFFTNLIDSIRSIFS